VIAFLKRLCRGTHYEMRVVAVEATAVLSGKLEDRSWLLNEVADLLDDEYWEVQAAAIKLLYSFLTDHFTIEEIKKSRIE
jgi:hypothetical protein